ncbi:HAD-IA family hydrolase [Streptococcus pluranimalium]|uniref:HAD-IA family hydrolase n=1 Tax=Streptococcus pluranimalium TaxID=82348 RepID=UPI002414E8FC|nr:HAD-IA family hydrolase [Streptococcus pluranimalium]WFM80385.1 HAD-IA family hydrolase [Streptococcus pluranimalium]
MTKKTFIWDFDGTLVDSYPAILESLEVTYQHFDLPFDRVAVEKYILEKSTGDLLLDLEKAYGISFEALKKKQSLEQAARDDSIVLMAGAIEVLEWARKEEIQNFIYTHKGATTASVLERLGISDYFTEVITSANGFKRKPHPQAIDYLVEKYQLTRTTTTYIGDRSLDMNLAFEADIKSINFKKSEHNCHHTINHLTDIMAISH